jgi:hypothetical protein
LRLTPLVPVKTSRQKRSSTPVKTGNALLTNGDADVRLSHPRKTIQCWRWPARAFSRIVEKPDRTENKEPLKLISHGENGQGAGLHRFGHVVKIPVYAKQDLLQNRNGQEVGGCPSRMSHASPGSASLGSALCALPTGLLILSRATDTGKRPPGCPTSTVALHRTTEIPEYGVCQTRRES